MQWKNNIVGRPKKVEGGGAEEEVEDEENDDVAWSARFQKIRYPSILLECVSAPNP